jgi:microcin C transport system substrate-binding protein
LKKTSKKLLPSGGCGCVGAKAIKTKFFCFFLFTRSSAYLLAFFAFPANAQDIITLSAASPTAFTHLPYANPDAPKGGAFTISSMGSFDNLNPFILRGTAPDEVFLVWQPLFKTSDTDSVTAYADLAQSVDTGADGLSVTFHLDPQARFSDGVKVTADDVVWTYRMLTTQGAPIYAELYTGVVGAAAPDSETAVFTLRKGTGRALILNLAEMYVLPAHFWRDRDFAAPLTVFPVGSGPYQVTAVAYGSRLKLSHMKNWWAADKLANRGFYNFDLVSEQFFRNDTTALQAFKAGQIDARIEHSPALWAEGYRDVAAGIALVRPPLSLPAGVNGLVMNTRRPIFANAAVRQALTLAYDFDWANRVLYHSEQTREDSYFSGTPMASSGLPAPAELALLQPFRAQIPAAVMNAPFQLPVTKSDGDNLPQLKIAFALLSHAGWYLRNFQLVDQTGKNFSFEILLPGPQDEPAAIAYAATLRQLGITAVIRAIDPAAYQRRLEDYDFDMTPLSIPATAYPDTEQAGYWGCAAAHAPGGYNLAGICSPAIDAMIADEIAAPDLPAKTAALHALDRLLLNGWYIIPLGSSGHENLAYWSDKFDKPAAPLQIGVDYDLWWAR